MKLHETIKRTYDKILKPFFKIEVLSDKGWEEISSLNISENKEVYEITTEPSNFTQVSEKLEEAGLEFLEAGVQMVPTTILQLDEKGVEKMERLIERLEELDDVANIYHNWEE